MKRNHTFHIPVMGTGFTVDTPLKVARYGISSAISLVDDHLIERIRKHYCGLYGEEYVPVAEGEEARSERIKRYLNLVNRAVQKQIAQIKSAPFEESSEITKYFELLSDKAPLKQEYCRMLASRDAKERKRLEEILRQEVVPGSIDVNIMTKLDPEIYKNGQKLPAYRRDAMTALKGFAQSDLEASVVFSAGLNLHLYGYVENFPDFHAHADGFLKKKVILKVSDFRSSLTQGKIFAKKGLWISEYRIESGLNCGGHVFPTHGHLLGPILEEFKAKRDEFLGTLFNIYQKAVRARRGLEFTKPHETLITVQGGIGTSQEARLLTNHYKVDGTGWATPFLLVPEVASVDDETRTRLVEAEEKDIYLSDCSPLGVLFSNLRDSGSETAREKRIESGNPGSPCFSRFLSFNTEYTESPICTASRQYQQLKIAEIKAQGLAGEIAEAKIRQVVQKSCICYDLGRGILKKLNLGKKNESLDTAVCPGPNLAFFSKIFTLKEMVSHIYGRVNLLNQTKERPHIFLQEIDIYVRYLKDRAAKSISGITDKEEEYLCEFKRNLLIGVEYYRERAIDLFNESSKLKEAFLEELSRFRKEIEKLALCEAPTTS